MELRQLEYFLAVFEEGSFTGASARVRIVQSAVSASVAALERELQVQLFDRTTRRVHATGAGVELAAHARLVLGAVEQARDAVAAVADGVQGTVRLGLMRALMTPPLAEAIARFHRDHPQVRLRPRTDQEGASGLIRAVIDNDLDLAVAAFDPGRAYSSVHITQLSREDLVFVCPPEHRFGGRRRIALADLVDEDFVDVPATWGSRAATDRAFDGLGLHRSIDIEVNDVATVVDLVRAGLEVALLARSSAPSLDGLTVARPSPAPRFHVGLVVPSARTPRPAAARLSAVIAQAHAADST